MNNLKNTRHAYLIVAHNNFSVLEKLIQLLDDERNDIYIHLDAKVKNFDFPFYENLVRKSQLIYTHKRIDVIWAGVSQIESELLLFQQALANEKGRYSYYHLLSGVDLPIKSQDYIHNFFDMNKGKEFIGFDIQPWRDDGVRYVNILTRFRNRRKLRPIIFKLNKIFAILQKTLNINMLARGGHINTKHGCNWVSLSNDCVKFIVKEMKNDITLYKRSYCADEVYKQTLVYKSEFKDRIYLPNCGDEFQSCMRAIDWKRGNPYIYTSEDFDQLINSNRLFARKFDENKDMDIVNKIYHHLSTLQNKEKS
ncbi:MAG: beta-1,6-N-acetylglucosaminyltransferase [Rikenellaceae bacterium]